MFLQSYNTVILQLLDTVFFFTIQPPPPHPPLGSIFLILFKSCLPCGSDAYFKRMHFGTKRLS